MAELKIVCRTNAGIALYANLPQLSSSSSTDTTTAATSSAATVAPVFEIADVTVRQFVYASNGSRMAYVSQSKLVVCDMATQQPVYEYEQRGLVDVSISPLGSYVCTWERLAKPDPETNAPHRNMLVHHVDSKQVVASYTHKQQSTWQPQWTSTESHYARLMPSEVLLYAPSATATSEDGQSMHTPVQRLKLDNVATISMSPGAFPHLALFVPESRNGQPAIVRVFSIKTFQAPIASKTFFKADRVRFVWNQVGNGVLVLTSTEVDQSGQSYYGESNLYYLSTAGNYDCRVALDKDGPVHDIAWSPNSKAFAVTYGFMPARTKLFNYRADAVFDFGAAPRNTLLFSPNGRVLVIGGFGNLTGDMDFWDLNAAPASYAANSGPPPRAPKLLASANAHSATEFQWSPCGRYLMTASLSPRMRVDNGWKLWHYRGVCVATQSHKELFQACWWPSSTPARIDTEPTPPAAATNGKPAKAADPNAKLVAHWDTRDLSPAPRGIQEKAAVAAKPAGVYRPPGARGSTPTFSVMRRDDEGSPVGRVGSPGADQQRGRSGTPASGGRVIPGAQYASPGSNSPAPAAAAQRAGPPGFTPKDSPTAVKRGGRQGGKQQQSPPSSAPGGRANGKNTTATTTAPAQQAAPVSDGADMNSDMDVAKQKKIRNMVRKLTAIEELKERRDRGDKLELTQLKKIDSEAADDTCTHFLLVIAVTVTSIVLSVKVDRAAAYSFVVTIMPVLIIKAYQILFWRCSFTYLFDTALMVVMAVAGDDLVAPAWVALPAALTLLARAVEYRQKPIVVLYKAALPAVLVVLALCKVEGLLNHVSWGVVCVPLYLSIAIQGRLEYVQPNGDFEVFCLLYAGAIPSLGMLLYKLDYPGSLSLVACVAPLWALEAVLVILSFVDEMHTALAGSNRSRPEELPLQPMTMVMVVSPTGTAGAASSAPHKRLRTVLSWATI
ncbi:hypothetical protein RI367_004447 [Sorochytrium milnesiophthora]